jgi:hypothetical protein
MLYFNSRMLLACLLALSVLSIANVQSLMAHPFHLCVGQMKWNSETQVWEVSLRLHPQDLEAAMTAERATQGATDKASIEDPNFSQDVTRYLQRYFYLRRTPLAMNSQELAAILKSEVTNSGPDKLNESTDTKSERSSLAWVGMEQERGWLWLHFELKQPVVAPEQQKLWLVHRLLLDTVERQENTLAIESEPSKKFSLQFQLGTEFKEFSASK